MRAKENITRSQRELTVKTSKPPKARKNARDAVVIGLSFPYDWLREGPNFSTPIKDRCEAEQIQSRNYFRLSVENWY